MKQSLIRGMLLIAALVFAGANLYAGEINGTVSAAKKKYIPNTVVYLDSVQGEFKPPTEHVLMDQKNLEFVPHILPILVGTTVDFRNSDDVAHNVFSPDEEADKVNLGTWPTGEIRSYTFKHHCKDVCAAVMLCNVHPEMEAYIVIMQNPYFAKVDADGKFVITDVPAGKYTLKVWHDKLKAEPQTVQVLADSSTTVAIELKK